MEFTEQNSDFELNFGEVLQGGEVTGVSSVNGYTGDVVLNATDVGAATSAQVAQAQANAQTYADGKIASAKTEIEAEIPTDTADLTNGADYQTSSDVSSTVSDAISTHNTSGVAHQSIRNSISTINGKIPSQASTSNQLADKAFVNSTTQTMTANFRGSYANWVAVPTDPTAYLPDYTGSTTPTMNDYLVVQDASDYPVEEGSEQLKGTWRFKYAGNWSTEGKTGWNPEYQVNEEPLTAAQIAALNSGITALAVNKLGNLADIKTIGTNLTLTNGELTATDTTYSEATTSTDGLMSSTDKTKLDGISTATAIAAGDTGYATGGQVFAAITDLAHKAKTGSGAPTTSTTADEVGQLYVDTTNQKVYYCQAISGSTYTWSQVGGGPTVVQTTGTSTTDVMSQNAVTSELYDGSSNPVKKHIKIGASAATTGQKGAYASVAVGGGAKANGEYGVAIGGEGYYPANASGSSSIAIGGYNPTASGEHSIAIGGYGANAAYKGSIALGSGATPTAIGEVNIGDTNSWYGYNNSNYRLLTGLHDPQNDHDAATKGYVDSHGGGPTVVQTTGTSTTDVMSQNAVTDMVFKNADTRKIQLGSSAHNNLNSANNNAVAIGDATIGSSAHYALSIGGAGNTASNTSACAIQGGNASGHSSIAMGIDATATQRASIAIGRGASATAQGQFDIGASLSAGDGYNSTNYRLLTGVHDGQSAHDAATVGQLNALIDAINAAANTNIPHIGS